MSLARPCAGLLRGEDSALLESPGWALHVAVGDLVSTAMNL